MKRATIKALMLFVILVQATAFAQEPNLLQYLDQKTTTLTAHQSHLLSVLRARPTSVEVRLVRFDNLSSILNRQSISLNLPTSLVRATLTYVEQIEGADFTWAGTIADHGGSILLTVTGTDATGIIHLQNTVFSIEPLGQGLHALIRLDQSKFPPEESPNAYLGQEENRDLPKRPLQAPLTPQANPVIDVLFAYTPAAASASSNINSLINSCISTTNNICANSSISPRVAKVYSTQVSYTESGDLETDVDRLQDNGDGYMDNIHALRDQYGADVVVLLVATGNNCGWAFSIEVNASGAFAAARTDCAVNNYTFAHEVGHLVGGRHDDDPASTPRAYAHGYVIKKGCWRTVMGLT